LFFLAGGAPRRCAAGGSRCFVKRAEADVKITGLHAAALSMLVMLRRRARRHDARRFTA
jgi:hypothetical protein